MNTVSNITDNFEFHTCEYLEIRPWVKEHCEKELRIECELRHDNKALLLVHDYHEVADFIHGYNHFVHINNLIYNKHTVDFFMWYIHNYGFQRLCIMDLLNHEHATTILLPMLKTLYIFGYHDNSWNQKIVKWIDPDVIQMILRGMTSEQTKTIQSGIDCLTQFIKECGYSQDTPFSEIRRFVARCISGKKSSIEFLNEHPMFIDEDMLALNPRFNEMDESLIPCMTPFDICRNYGAIDLLKKLHSSHIIWHDVLGFHRDVQFVEDHINDCQLQYNQQTLLQNRHLMPVIERHIDKIDRSALSILSFNPSAIEFLQQHRELVDHEILRNPNIVTYAYHLIKQERSDLHNDLQAYLWHPDRIRQWIENGNDLEDYLL